MSYSGLGSFSNPVIVPAPYDYLSNGPGMAELQRIGAQTVTALLGQGAQVPLIRSSATTPQQQAWVPGNQSIGAVWSALDAAVVASITVDTLVANERRKSVNARATAYGLAGIVIQRVTEKLLNGGDPSICQLNFGESMKVAKAIYPAIQVPAGYTPTGWCERALVFSETDPCRLVAICKWKTDASGKSVAVAAPPPPAGAVLAPPAASTTTPQPPPTHADLDRAAESDANTKAEAEFWTYMGALSQGREWLTYALGRPATATDDVMWAALRARGISPEEATDWFVGCDANLDCFREKMNKSLGDAEQRTRDKRVKIVVGVAALGAAAFAWHVYRGGKA